MVRHRILNISAVKVRVLAAILFVIVLPASLDGKEVGEFGRFRALIIANANYLHLEEIDTAIKDAGLVADVLRRKYGFDVSLLLNASRRTIISGLEEFRRELESEDNLVIFYIGHGTLDAETEQGFWLPIDAEKDNTANWIDNGRIKSILKGTKARHVLMVASFFYDPVWKELTRGIELKGEPSALARGQSRRVLLPGGSAASEGDVGSYTDFAQNFVAALSKDADILFGRDVFDAMTEHARNFGQSIPRYEVLADPEDQSGYFPFVSAYGDAGTPKLNEDPEGEITPSEEILEEAFWNLVKDERDYEFFEAFLERFPEGQYAPNAKTRSSELAATPSAAGLSAPDPQPEVLPGAVTHRVLRDANVRAGPSTAYERLTALSVGTEVEVLEPVEGGNWFRIRLPDGEEAFIYGSLIEPIQ